MNTTNTDRHTSFPHSLRVQSAVFSQDGRRVATASSDKTARVWELESFKPVTPRLQHTGVVYSARFDPTGRWLVTASADRTARVWSSETGWPRYSPLQHGNVVYCAEFSPDGRWILTACADKRAHLWDASTGQAVPKLFAHADEVQAAGFSSDGQYFFTASKDGMVRVWETRSGRPVGQALKHDGAVQCARFSPDGRRIVTASMDKTARVWETATGRSVTGPLAHESRVYTASFSPDGKRVLTSSLDGTVRIWDAETGQPCAGLRQHPKGVDDAKFNPEGSRVAAICADWNLYIWDFTPLEAPVPAWLADLAEAVAGQRMSSQQAFEFASNDALFQTRDRLGLLPASDPSTRWLNWFLGDRAARFVSPWGLETLESRIRKLCRESRWSNDEAIRAALLSAVRYDPDNVLVISCLARLMIGGPEDSQDSAEANWLTRRAMDLGGAGDAEAWWARSLYLDKVGDLAAAIDAIERAIGLDPKNPCLLREKARFLEKAGRVTLAAEAFARAIDLVEQVASVETANEFRAERARILKRHGLLMEARGDFFRAKNILPRDPQTPENLINLDLVYNAGLDDSWAITSSRAVKLASLPRGRQTLEDVEFDLRGIVQLRGAGPQQARGDYPKAVENIPVNQRCHRLHFLHAAQGTDPDETEIGAYVVRYADGQMVDIPIVYGY
ncbi:MAG: hypothetical protein N3G20_03865, partial [Verrucomicrobiae bacterium]|nr:hypothetical protein [Verrucomicrobiae bacterium]